MVARPSLLQRFEKNRASDRVTPEDLNVAPELLGLRLARPGRRLLAIGVDVLAVTLLSSLGNAWLLAGCVLLIAPKSNGEFHLRLQRRRVWIWAFAAVLLAVGAQQMFTSRGHSTTAIWDDDDADTDDATDSDEHDVTVVGPRSARRALAEIARENRAEAHARASSAAFTAASAASASTPGSALSAPAAPSPEAHIALLEAQLAEARKPKHFDPHAEAERWLHKAGIRFGWALAYFTLLPAWWNGQTVGKRLFKLRVVELTGKPMTVMRCLKRYGGYAAGMATGLFGFAQVFWDSNRQAIQDKTAHTVVIDLAAEPVDNARPSG
jgi:uncharacterized RDD family membrane protein YckC